MDSAPPPPESVNRASPKRAAPSVRREAVINLAFAGLRAFILLYMLRYAGLVLTVQVLGLFLLSRRFASTAANFLQLGTTQTINRYVSIHHQDRALQRGYLVVAFAFIVVGGAILLPLAWGLSEPLGRVIFSDAAASAELTFWTWAWTLATVAALLATSFLLTERLIVTTNLLRLMTIGGAPLIALMVIGSDAGPEGVVRLATLVMGGCALVALLGVAARYRLKPLPPAASWRETLRTFVQYGIPRGGSALLEALTAFLPPWLLREQPEAAGFLIIALTLLRALELVILPVTQVLALATARAIGRNDEGHIARAARLLFGLALYLGCFAFVFLYPWLDRLLLVWLGQADLAAEVYPYAAWVVFGIVPVIVYYSLRNMVEVVWTFPYNLVAQLASIAVLLGVCFGLRASTSASLTEAVMIGNLAMLWTMGVLTVVWMRHHLPGPRFLGLWRLLAMCVVIFAAQAGAAWSGGATEAALAVALSAAVVAVGCCFRPPPLVAALAAAMMPRRRKSIAAEEGLTGAPEA
jgi:O-antigen/teichoic acid export membrane protein